MSEQTAQLLKHSIDNLTGTLSPTDNQAIEEKLVPVVRDLKNILINTKRAIDSRNLQLMQHMRVKLIDELKKNGVSTFQINDELPDDNPASLMYIHDQWILYHQTGILESDFTPNSKHIPMVTVLKELIHELAAVKLLNNELKTTKADTRDLSQSVLKRKITLPESGIPLTHFIDTMLLESKR